VLIVDAQSYSATDIFAVGFQDHDIGDVLGCAAQTGAGGATVASHDDLLNLDLEGGNPYARSRQGSRSSGRSKTS